MAFQISQKCIKCGSCEAECPTGAISEGENQYNIDPDVCISCGLCVGVCQEEAISEEQ